MEVSPTTPRSQTSPRLEPIADEGEFERFLGAFTSYERMRRFDYGRKTMRLERMAALARELGDPHLQIPAVHVAGTKGKGSTCLILDALLRAGGRHTGVYTSPHVERLRERIAVDGDAIGEAELCRTLNSMLPLLRERRRGGEEDFPTFFELMTALAMLHFRDRGVRHAIYEVGLGGRLDATNILRPQYTVITGIGLEHTQALGNTVGRIAREKAGIIKTGVPIFIPPMSPEADAAIRDVARSRAAPTHTVSADSVVPAAGGRLRVAPFHGSFAAGAIRGPGLRTDLALAVAVWIQMLADDGEQASAEDLARALEDLALPVRIELLPLDPPVVLDGAHTEASIRTLVTALEEMRFPAPRTAVFSLAEDKNAASILPFLARSADEFILTRCDPVRSADPARLAAALGELAPGRATVIVEDPVEAFETARRRETSTLVTGSIYLAGALRRHLNPEMNPER